MRHPESTSPQSTPKTRHRQGKKRVVIALNLAVLLVIGAGAAAYGTLGKTVTLDVDGQTESVRVFSGSVGSLLESQDVEVAASDDLSVRPSEPVSDGETIKVRYAKEVTVAVDGEVETSTVHAATAKDALDALEVDPEPGARMNVDAEKRLDRSGEQIVVSNPKKVTVVADGKKKTVRSAAPTAQEVVEAAGVKLGEADQLDVGDAALVQKDATIKVLRISMEDKTETIEKKAPVEYRDDDSMPEGETKVLEPGAPTKIRENVLVTYANGKVKHRLVLTSEKVGEAKKRIVARGTGEPEPEPVDAAEPETAAAVADGSVWDQLAQCESGGNWAANTGNGYYGGVQFSPQTWSSLGGPGLPHENSREVQIKYAKILQAQSGWGQWPSCSAKLGLR